MTANEVGQICVICNLEIQIGDEISWNRRGNAGRYHVRCKGSQPNFTVSAPVSNGNDPLAAMLAASIQPYISLQREELTEELETRIEEKIAEALANLPKELKTVYFAEGQKIGEIDGQQHHKFDELMLLVRLRKNVYLWGEAGSGKSTSARKIAELLNLPFRYTALQAQMTASALTGYMDATGKYVESELYKAYKFGGVFLLDELELGSGNLLGSLNGALANGECAFPCGLVKRHPDFICIATGNTPALGATVQFSDRRALDGAVRDRFHFIEWNTDRALELAASKAYFERCESWVDWVRNVRQLAKTNHPKLTCTQRASIEGAQLLAVGVEPIKAAEMLVFRGYDAMAVRGILESFPLPQF